MRWVVGAILAGGFFAISFSSLFVVLVEHGPSPMTCAEFATLDKPPRWVALRQCRLDYSSKRSLREKRGLTGLKDYVPIVLESEARGALWVRLDEEDYESFLKTDLLKGMVDVRTTEDIPKELDHANIRILYTDRPAVADFILGIVPLVAYCAFAARGLRRRRLEHDLMVKLRNENTGADLPEALDITPLLKARSSLFWTLPAWILCLVGSSWLIVVLERALVGPILAAIFVLLGLVVWYWLYRKWHRFRLVRRTALAVVLPIVGVSASPVVLTTSSIDFLGTAALVTVLGVLSIPAWLACRSLLKNQRVDDLLAIDMALQTRVRPGIKQIVGRRFVQTYMYRLIAGAVLLAGVIVAGAFMIVVGAGLGLILGTFVAISMLLWQRGRRHATPTAEEVGELDQRAPILFLRSFIDDELSSSKSSSASLAEVAAGILNAVGPVVALPAPQEKLPPIGPYRIAVAGESWQETIDDLSRKAKLIVALLGHTKSLIWEIKQISAGEASRKLCLIFPPVGVLELVRRWEVVRRLAQEIPVFQKLAALNPEQVLLVYENRAGLTEVITCKRRSARAYRAALVRVAEQAQ